MNHPYLCPHCLVDLEDDGTAVTCWRCRFEVREIDNPTEYHDRSDAVSYTSNR